MKRHTLYCTLATGVGLMLTTWVVWLCAMQPALADPSVRCVAETGADGSNDCKNPGSPFSVDAIQGVLSSIRKSPGRERDESQTHP
jgi:hypothetical protein